ncbi:MAG: SRPBCC family protein [Proteobacteria bacterium]|nr:SRPBCC family protein [Pseudomonadota bacterium]
MASIRKEVVIEAPPAEVWSAVRDYGQVHTRLCPGVVVDTRMESGELRVVTFASGLVLRELIVDVDDQARRFVWSAIGGRAKHHNGAMQVLDEGPRASRLVWVADILPHNLGPVVAAIMEEGLAVTKAHLEAKARRAA